MTYQIITQDQFNEVLAELRGEFRQLRSFIRGDREKLKTDLFLKISKKLEKRFPNVQCGIEVDCLDIEHPKITIKQTPLSNPQRRRHSIQGLTEYHIAKDKLVRKYGVRTGTFLANRLSKMIRKRKATCIDNLRIARVGYRSSEIAYEESRKNGCCGFADEEFKFTRFKLFDLKLITSTWKIGFNYGH